jgi:hypothetical protein
MPRIPGMSAAIMTPDPTAADTSRHGLQPPPSALTDAEHVGPMAAYYRALGFAYVVVEATNCWTGAACDVLGGVRVHFAPFRARLVVPASPAPLPGTASSPDGYVSAKDAGSMYHVLGLA